MEKDMKILMVLTSHDVLGNTGRKAGFWLEEFAAPSFVFRDAGVQRTLASPQPFSVVDGRLITGQNSASSTVAAQNLINLLAAEKAA
jgi:putative intracellular protease/amidase